jgi:hypothetical protein
LAKRKKPGRKGTSPRLALASLAKPRETAPPVRRRTALETMHNMRAITDRQKWAGERFRAGWEAVSGGVTAVERSDFDPWMPRGNRAPMGAQLRTYIQVEGAGGDYLAACKAMDLSDALLTDRHGNPRQATAPGTIKRVVAAVCCEERSCTEIDRAAGKQNGWASAILKEGLAIYLRMFGGNFKDEVPAYLRGAA